MYVSLAAHPTLFASANAGQTWTRIGLDGYNIARLIVEPLQSDHLYAIRELILRGGGLSSDAGQTWRLAEVYDFPGTSDLAADFFAASTIYTSFSDPIDPVDNGVVYKTPDAGDDWRLLLRSGSGDYVLAANPRRLGVVLASADTDGLFLTQNGGTTWTRLQLPIVH